MVKEKLIKARKDKKFSQQDMAKHLNISQSHYLRKEKGEIGIRDDEWERMAKLLDMEIEDIKESEKDNGISQSFENVTDIKNSYIGSNNIYCNVPEFLLENQQEYINILKKENEDLKNKIAELEKKTGLK
ncbi:MULTISPECIES: helix-turn-helix transcriptional regulator [Chryseobacterium]|uniref:Helix-turn-helix n=1 Tax=Chryseobacterium taihuense TaxID=1141221 RepID=A0A1G9PKH9_9FLAO|nr:MULTISPECIES: helix-turn-helix transcriptional regulator [Chryseobacterium]MXS71668.1 helix-turn-helix domain-containing protein [Flavobacteriaceae bacterium W22]QQV03808.1 helix-turn-helix transcriptional regulator [Chryseobacterium sp. FDAARGOS 1104]SDL99214.1 Helix-turn-helix [Chryseobacterium taihuense]VFB02849.1 Helix-turn-helix [Chryseobacterium taihuense]